MTKDITFTDRIHHVERLDNSRLGNPSWLVYFEVNGMMQTMTDTSWSYEADNPEWRNAKVEVTMTPGGRIRYITHAR